MALEGLRRAVVDISVVISTYNRSGLLGETLQSVLEAARGTGSEGWEVVVADNNSSDDTRNVVQSVAAREPRVRYVFEGRQGVSYGRNTAVKGSRGALVFITDDDVLVDPSWLEVGLAGFGDAGVSFVMGRILPRWDAPKPAWIPDEFTGPVGVCDLGDATLPIERGSLHLPMTANLGIRREVFDRIGGFNTELGPHGRNTDHGNGEDYEFGLRLVEAGHVGLYLPTSVVRNRINAGRLTHAYFRGWQVANGQASSVMGRGREQHLKHWFGVPRYKYREAVRHAVQWVEYAAVGRMNAAFVHELHLRQFVGFAKDRWT